MQVLLQCSRLVLLLSLILVLDSSVQGKTQDSCPCVIFFVSPRVHIKNYTPFKVQNVLCCGKIGLGKRFMVAELLNVSLVKFGTKKNETLRRVKPCKLLQ